MHNKRVKFYDIKIDDICYQTEMSLSGNRFLCRYDTNLVQRSSKLRQSIIQLHNDSMMTLIHYFETSRNSLGTI